MLTKKEKSGQKLKNHCFYTLIKNLTFNSKLILDIKKIAHQLILVLKLNAIN
jgi:hypothetical protein